MNIDLMKDPELTAAHSLTLRLILQHVGLDPATRIRETVDTLFHDPVTPSNLANATFWMIMLLASENQKASAAMSSLINYAGDDGDILTHIPLGDVSGEVPRDLLEYETEAFIESIKRYNGPTEKREGYGFPLESYIYVFRNILVTIVHHATGRTGEEIIEQTSEMLETCWEELAKIVESTPEEAMEEITAKVAAEMAKHAPAVPDDSADGAAPDDRPRITDYSETPPHPWQESREQAVYELVRLYDVLRAHRKRAEEIDKLKGVWLTHTETLVLTDRIHERADRCREKVAEIRKIWDLPLPAPELVDYLKLQ